MKILFDASHFFACKGGGHYNQFSKLIPKLIETVSSNSDLISFINIYFRTKNPCPVFLKNANVFNLHLPVKLINKSWITFNFPDLRYLYGKYDIFHSPHFSLPIFSKTKKVLTVHDLTYLLYPEYFSPNTKELNDYGYKLLLSNNVHRADRLIAISHNTKNDLIEYFKLPEEKITVIHIGCSIPSKIPEERLNEILFKLGLRNSQFIYFPVGTYEPRKNLERTINAFRKINRSNIKLVISGVGNINWLDKNLINDDIVFVRWDSEEERDALYQSAIFAIYPSLYEGFGIPALEALANGKALLSSNTSSLPEIAKGYAHLINPHSLEEIADGIHLLLIDEKYRNELEKKSIERAKSFSWEKMAEETYSVYKSII